MGNLFHGPTPFIILFVVLLLFGAPKLPALAKSLGQSMKILKKEVTTNDDEKPADNAASPAGPASPAAPAATPVIDPSIAAELEKAKAEAAAAKAEADSLRAAADVRAADVRAADVRAAEVRAADARAAAEVRAEGNSRP